MKASDPTAATLGGLDQETCGRIGCWADPHFYQQAGGVAFGNGNDPATNALRMRSTRALWDPTYVDESWINSQVRLLPRMRELVSASYPGTKTAITEYNWGGLDHVNGALAQADILGIFGRERLDLATLWSPPAATDPGAFAFRIYATTTAPADGSATSGSGRRARTRQCSRRTRPRGP